MHIKKNINTNSLRGEITVVVVFYTVFLYFQNSYNELK